MLTRKERLLHIFEGIVPDRSAVKIWGVTPFEKCPIPVFEPVRQLAVEKTELVVTANSLFNLYCGINANEYINTYDIPTDSAEWLNQVTEYRTPQGILREVFKKSRSGKPGYRTEYPIKQPSDIQKLLAMPYSPFPLVPDNYYISEYQLGDTGITIFALDNALYGLARLIGSENFALWSFDHQFLLLEAIQVFSDRICAHAKTALSHGISGIFGWVGPELCIPPLMSPQGFDIYCLPYDKRLADLIHNGGGYIWLHCHGKMRRMIQRFVDMGVDVLNPIEPPPMGDITIKQAFDVVEDQMALEGGIQTHDLMTSSISELENKTHSALEAGACKRFILCPSAGYMSNTEPSQQEIANWLFYITEGVRYAEKVE